MSEPLEGREETELEAARRRRLALVLSDPLRRRRLVRAMARALAERERRAEGAGRLQRVGTEGAG